MMNINKHNLLISEGNVRTILHGVYDTNLLCADCDNALGSQLDDYALDVCRRFPREHRSFGDGYFVLDNVDGDRFTKFVLSVLWRASISTRPEFRDVSLGPYETPACEVIFGAAPITRTLGYELIVSRYRVRPGFNPEENYTTPLRQRFDGLNGWGFSLHGFHMMAKLDKRPLPANLRPAIVNGNTKLTGAYVDFLSTNEGKAILEIARTHRRRAGG
jgi:hypothetical protein